MMFWTIYIIGMLNASTMFDGHVEPFNFVNWCVAALNFYCATLYYGR
jgi:hypothetical protein